MESSPGEFHPEALADPGLCGAYGYGESDAWCHMLRSVAGMRAEVEAGVTPHK
jgi:hypothetical protein